MNTFYAESLEVYRFIVLYTSQHLYPSSMQEIGKKFHCSKSVVFERCKDLELHGYIQVTKGISRVIKLVGYELVKCKSKKGLYDNERE